MRLYIVQHGDALAKEQDPERPLSRSGTSDVERLAQFLSKTGITTNRVLHSGKTRARQTAEILAKVMMPGVKLETSGILNPTDPPEPVGRQIAQWNEDTLLVGHLPFVARLVAHLLTGNDNNTIVTYQPGSVVCLEQTETGGWSLQWMLNPNIVPGDGYTGAKRC